MLPIDAIKLLIRRHETAQGDLVESLYREDERSPEEEAALRQYQASKCVPGLQAEVRSA